MNYPVIGSKIIYIDGTNNVLLVRRGETAPSRAGDWELPGGFVESDEEPIFTAIREGEEEVGITANNPKYVYAHTIHTKNFTGFYFAEQLNNRPEVTLSYEHDDYQWLPFEQAIKKVTVPLYKFAIANSMKYLGFENIVSVKAIITNGGNGLTLRRSAGDLGAGNWDLPGGQVEPGEALDRAIKREIREETGLVAIEPKILFGHAEIREAEKQIRIRIGYSAFANINDVTLSNEHDGYEWVKKGHMYEHMKHPNWPGWGDFVKSFG